jgi:hypothetical protein
MDDRKRITKSLLTGASWKGAANGNNAVRSLSEERFLIPTILLWANHHPAKSNH